MYITTTGLILREVEYKESSAILTVLTKAEGKITVSAKGVRRKGSKLAAAVQHLAYSELTLFFNRGRWTLTEARLLEMFPGLREDLDRLSVASYFAECVEAVADEDSYSPEILSLALNSLFALHEGKKSVEQIKACFELRLMCIAGFAPMVSHCEVCGTENPEEPMFSAAGGCLHCKDCPSAGASLPLCSGSLSAVRHVTACDPKRIFSFTLGEDALKRFSAVTENYILTQLERGFRTLEFYKSTRLPK